MKRRRSRSGAKLGQHFLTAPTVADALADAANIQPEDTVLEIGPGKGILTRALLSRGARIVAVEKDPELVTVLTTSLHNEIQNGTLTLINADIRDVSPERLGLKKGGYVLAANIPYYITGEIIRTFLSRDAQPHTIALLVQKEVAERIARSPKESLLSLSVKAYGSPRYVQTVKRGSFSPPPSVDSAVITITNISRSKFEGISEDAFFEILHAAFAAKRKLLISNLARAFAKDAVLKACAECGVQENARAEDVHIETWMCLVKHLQGNH